MMVPQISVIVPVYNAENTLRQCVESILSQKFKDFELILVDDGSNDESPTICDEFKDDDSRVRVFHESNGGVSYARNIGLDHARGEWITFVDSDDYVRDGYFDGIGLFEDDLLLIPYMGIKKGQSLFDQSLQNYDVIKGDKNLRDFYNEFLTTQIFRGPCAKFYKKNLIGNNRFNEKMKVGEDIVFVHQYLVDCNSIRCYHGSSYVVRLSETTASVKYSCSTDYAVESLMFIHDSFEKVMEKWNLDKSLFLSYLFYFKMISQSDWQKEPSRWYRDEQVSQLYKYVWSYLSFKQRMKHHMACLYSVIRF